MVELIISVRPKGTTKSFEIYKGSVPTTTDAAVGVTHNNIDSVISVCEIVSTTVASHMTHLKPSLREARDLIAKRNGYTYESLDWHVSVTPNGDYTPELEIDD